MKPVDELILELKTELKTYLNQCLSTFTLNDTINGLGIFTDADMSSFIVYINTKEHLNERNLNAGNDDEKLTNTWWLPEWYWESKNLVEEERIIDITQNIFNQLEFYDCKRTLFKTYCEVLAQLDGFDLIRLDESFVRMVQESDNFNAATDKKDLSKLLTESQWNEYLRFNKYWLGY